MQQDKLEKLDYKNNSFDMGREVSEFLKEIMVRQLNSNKDFTYFRDAYEAPYATTPIASIAIPNPSIEGMDEVQKKLTYSQLLMRQKHVEEWPHVARQITASISAMLTKKTHSKVKSVYFEAWSTAINNGEVSAMIKMIQNGLTLKTPSVKQYDQLAIKKEVMDFTRAEAETCNDCIQRYHPFKLHCYVVFVCYLICG